MQFPTIRRRPKPASSAALMVFGYPYLCICKCQFGTSFGGHTMAVAASVWVAARLRLHFDGGRFGGTDGYGYGYGHLSASLHTPHSTLNTSYDPARATSSQSLLAFDMRSHLGNIMHRISWHSSIVVFRPCPGLNLSPIPSPIPTSIAFLCLSRSSKPRPCLVGHVHVACSRLWLLPPCGWVGVSLASVCV